MINIIGWTIVVLNLGSMIIHLVFSMSIKKQKSKLTNRVHKHSYVINFYQDSNVRNLQDMFFIKSDYDLLKKLQSYDDIIEPILEGEFTGNELIYLSTLGLIYLQEEIRKTERI